MELSPVREAFGGGASESRAYQTCQGEFEQARAAVSRFLASTVKGGEAEIAGLDTEMHIALASNDITLASELAENLRHVASSVGGPRITDFGTS